LTHGGGCRTDVLVHLLFLDESGQLSERRFFALGGVALRDSEWHELRDLWQTTLEAHGWPAAREVKWHGIRTGEVPPALANAIVKALARSPLRCYVTLLDIELGLETAPEFFTTDEETYATGLMFLAERFQLLLESTDDVGLIVVDSRFREDDARLRRFFADLTRDGSSYSRLNRIVEGLFLGPSHFSIGLQCADLVCAITAAAERGNGQARGYLKQLLPRFATHPATGELTGSASSASPSVRGGPARPTVSSSSDAPAASPTGRLPVMIGGCGTTTFAPRASPRWTCCARSTAPRFRTRVVSTRDSRSAAGAFRS
jgi:hypothetical protein